MRIASLLLTSLLLAACGDDDSPPPPPSDAGPRDSGLVDSSTGEDSGPTDGGRDGSTVDPDAGLTGCNVDPLELGMDFISRARPVAVEPLASEFAVVWGQAGGANEAVWATFLGADGAPTRSQFLTAGAGTARNVATGGGVAVWQNYVGPGNVLETIAVLPAEGSLPTALTDAAHDSQLPAVVALGEDRWLFSYAQARDGMWTLRTTVLDGTTVGASTEVATLGAATPSALAIVGEAPAVVWADAGRVRLQRLDAAGAPSGEPIVLDTENNAVGPVALAFDETGGLVVFAVSVEGRPEIRSRLLLGDGTPRTFEQVVSAAPTQGSDFAVATYEGGFAVAYRARLVEMRTFLQLAFVHGSDGNVVATVDLGDGAFTDGRPALAVDNAGLLVASWAETAMAGTQLRAGRLSCPEAWLRCSPRGDR